MSRDLNAIMLDDALRAMKRREAEDQALGLIPTAPTSASLLPKSGVKRSGHLGSFARKPRTRTHGVAAMPRTSHEVELLASGQLPNSYWSNRRGLVESGERHSRGTSVSTAAQQADTARFATGHDFTA